MTFAAPSNSRFLYRLLLGDLADAPERVRERMLETIPTSLTSLAVYSVTLLMICGTAVYVTRAPWAWWWLAISAACIAWRAVPALIEWRGGGPQHLPSVMLSSGVAMTTFGFACAQCIRLQDVALTAMALSGTMGVMAGIATRWAAVPRPAIATMLLSVAPPMVELASRGGASIFAAGALAFSAISITTFAVQNRRALLASVTASELLRRKAQTDHLTGLANRAELLQGLEDACLALPPTGAPGKGRHFSVLYIDLDGFKSVNDLHGHATGDEILQRVADRLRRVVGPEELVARIGGDEFVVLLSDADQLTARGVADALIAEVSREYHLAGGRTLRIGCTVGVSTAPDQGRSAHLLLSSADSALYDAKAMGKGQTGLFRTISDT